MTHAKPEKMRTTIFLITLLFTAAVIKAATITVCPDCECSSIGQAIELANAGDEVLIILPPVETGTVQTGNHLS